MSYWIWFPGDFEIRHGLKVNCRREERMRRYPAIWRVDDCGRSVRLRRKCTLTEAETVLVRARGEGQLRVDGAFRPLNEPVCFEPGAHELIVELTRMNGLPCAYVEGKSFASGAGWEAQNFAGPWQPCGFSEMYTDPDDDPEQFKFAYSPIEPTAVTPDGTGVLYDFGRETFARLHLSDLSGGLTVCYGESETEARDVENCYILDRIPAGQTEADLPARAFRYLFFPGAKSVSLRAEYEYLPLEERGSFTSGDPLLNEIWRVAAYTFHLNSRECFLDGIKRDRWVWSGDAYQSYFVNRVLYMDKELCRRTIWALRGKDPIEQHINTILDYSLYWVMSVGDYYETFGDADFVRQIWPRVRTMMDYCRASVNADGFLKGRENDWVFIDWAEMDKEGALFAEQVLFIKALEAAARCAELSGEDGGLYIRQADELRARLDEFFYDEEKGCYIDGYASGKRNVTRHGNIFAILFDIADAQRQASLVQNVLDNPDVPPITTPYFKFFELWALCKLGRTDKALERVRDYWGGMLALGATTMWEQFDPREDFPAHYGMYGMKYDRSFCHAWGAGPIYLLGAYHMGLRPTAPGYATFVVAPDASAADSFEGTLPLPDGQVEISLKDGRLTVRASRDGGVAVWNNQRVSLPAGETVTL